MSGFNKITGTDSQTVEQMKYLLDAHGDDIPRITMDIGASMDIEGEYTMTSEETSVFRQWYLSDTVFIMIELSSERPIFGGNVIVSLCDVGYSANFNGYGAGEFYTFILNVDQGKLKFVQRYY